MEKKIIFCFCMVLFFLTFVSASPISNNRHLNLQFPTGAGSFFTGTADFEFRYTENQDCSSPFYVNTTSLTTDQNGYISYYLNNVNETTSNNQRYLCIYKDGTLEGNFSVAPSDYTFYALNSSGHGIIDDSNIYLGTHNMTASWFFGQFNWTIDSSSQDYLTFDGSTLIFSQSFLNQTISQFGVDGGFNSTFNSTYDSFAYNETDTLYSQINTTIDLVINSSGFSGLWYNYTLIPIPENSTVISIENITDISFANVNSSRYWDNLDTPSDINAGDINDDNTYARTDAETFTGQVNFSRTDAVFPTSTWKLAIQSSGVDKIRLGNFFGLFPSTIQFLDNGGFLDDDGSVSMSVSPSLNTMELTAIGGLYINNPTFQGSGNSIFNQNLRGLGANATLYNITASNIVVRNSTNTIDILGHNHDPDNNPSRGLAIPHNFSNVNASRSFGTIYTNTKSRTIEVLVYAEFYTENGESAYITAYTKPTGGTWGEFGSEGVVSGGTAGSEIVRGHLAFSVNPGQKYEVNSTNSASGIVRRINWIEKDD